LGSLIDLTGQKFGKWLVIKRREKPKSVKFSAVFWLCQCSCGNKKIVNSAALRKGISKSCGCLRGGNSAWYNQR